MLTGHLLPKLFLRGLGELLTLHVTGDRVLLGTLAVERGRVVFKDREFMAGVTPAQVMTCIESGIIGAVCELADREWETLSFLGPENCDIPTDLSATRTGLLRAARSKDGESLMDFEGSWYRGFNVMLGHHFLPLVSMLPLPTRRNTTGLAVCDLRMATVPLAVLQRVHDAVRVAVDRQLTLDVQDVDVDSDEFNKLFGAYLPQE